MWRGDPPRMPLVGALGFTAATAFYAVGQQWIGVALALPLAGYFIYHSLKRLGRN